jgi:hypothetical protein
MDNLNDSDMSDLMRLAVGDLKTFYSTPVDPTNTQMSLKRAELAVKVLGRANGADSTRVKKQSLAFQLAKAIGVKGDELKPLLESIIPNMRIGIGDGSK